MINTEDFTLLYFIIQLCSGITHGRVLNGELYAQVFQKLIYLHLFTDCFMKISLQSSEQMQFKEFVSVSAVTMSLVTSWNLLYLCQEWYLYGRVHYSS